MKRFLTLIGMVLCTAIMPVLFNNAPAHSQTPELIEEILDWRTQYDAIVLESASIVVELDKADMIVDEFDAGRYSTKQALVRLDQLEQDIISNGTAIARKFEALPELSPEALTLAPFLPEMLALTRQSALETSLSFAGVIDLYRAFVTSDGDGATDKLVIASLRRLIPPMELENDMVQVSLDGMTDQGTPARNLGQLSIYSNSILIHFLQAEILFLRELETEPEVQSALSLLEAAEQEILNGRLRTSQTLISLNQKDSAQSAEEEALRLRALAGFKTFETSFRIETDLAEVLTKLVALQADGQDSLNHPDREQLLLDMETLISKRLAVNAKRLQMFQR